MSTFYARLIETALGISVDAPLLAIVADHPASDGVEGKTAYSVTFPRTCLPDASEVTTLPTTESYLANLKDLIAQKKPRRLFLAPPILRQELAAEAIRSEYSRLDFDVIALQAALKAMPNGASVATIMPAGFFQWESSRSARSRLFAQFQPKLLITHAHCLPDVKSYAGYNLGLQLGLPVLGGFPLNTLVVGVGQFDRSMRFIKCMKASDGGQQDDVVADLCRLLKQGVGKSKYGFVIREGLPSDAPLMHELYESALITKQQSIAGFVDVRQLSDLAEIRSGFHVGSPLIFPAGAGRVHDVRVVSGRDIGLDGAINTDATVERIEASTTHLLHQGDLCIGAISRDRIRFAEVSGDILPAVANHTVFSLRFKPGLSSEVRQTLVAYLRSVHAMEQLKLRASTMGDAVRLTVHLFSELPIPVLNASLSAALKDTNESISQFRDWIKEAELSRDALFEFAKPSEDQILLQSIGRLSRRRCDAARLVSDLHHRIRTQFPYPIAFRWRTVEASHPDLEGYLNVLGCAEVTVCYLACMALLLPRVLSGFQLKYAGEIAKNLSNTKHGTSMGDWMAIVREVRGAKVIRKHVEPLPFRELASLDEETDQALQRLSSARNAQSHERGPKGSDIKHCFEKCRSDLEVFLEGIEFVTEYPLRLIERAKPDSILKRTEYQFRELVGDHPLVPIQTGHTSQPELEESLYLADRGGKLHLLRPYLNLAECPECKRWSLFYLDRYSKKEKKCFLKSMEHGHPFEADASIMAAFQHVGLVPI